MAHHKRGRARNRRAGCKLCKPWKVTGHAKGRPGAETISSYRSRIGTKLDLRDALRCD
ncbi:hypothetical protein [Rhodovarius crocodyli]|uniref:hypothetical protein n=1 Tax=Rhodovarius crocodyli TaxID=1979269 RepID=UPI0013E3F848|nr:hypothetical protein [Rhodovarius crocodyli]